MKASEATSALIAAQEPLIASLAVTASLAASPDATKPDAAVVGILSDMEVYTDMAGLVDFAEERAKLERERAKVEKDLEKLTKKLSNPGFLAKAAPEIIAKDTAKRDELADQRDKIDAQLAQM